MDQQIIELYDDFAHRHFDRRKFLESAAKHVGGMAAAVAALSVLQSNYAFAAVVAEGDPRIRASRVTYNGETGPVRAYLATPTSDGKRGGVLVVHQNRGLNPHIEDIARRLATAGYVAIAADFLSPLGGTPPPSPGKPVDGVPEPPGGWPPDESAATALFSKLDIQQTIGNGKAGLAYLRSRSDSNGKTGVIGFCWGGGVVNQLAVNDAPLDAGVVYYGAAPKLDDVPKIKAALLLNYADPKMDTRIGAAIPAYDDALRAAGKIFELHYYMGANHAFNDDTSARYNPEAAKLAWERTLAFFRRYLN